MARGYRQTIHASSCSTYLVQFANEGLLAADGGVRLVTGSNQPPGVSCSPWCLGLSNGPVLYSGKCSGMTFNS